MGTLTIITPPARQPVTLEEAKHALHIDGDDEDVLILGMIRSATEFAERYTSLRLISQTIELTMDRFPGTEFTPDVWPLQSIDSVKYDDTSSPVTEITLVENTDYYADVTTMGGRIRAVSGWPSVAVQPNAVRIRMTAGFTPGASDDAENIPELIKDGIKAYVIYLYDGAIEMQEAAKQLLWSQRRI